MQLDPAKVRAVLAEVGLDPEGDPLEAVRSLGGQISTLTARVRELEPLADDGRAYRGDLIEETITEGVRAFGNDFPAETFRGMLASQGLEAIKKLRDHHRAVASRNFPGGRRSVDDVTEDPDREDAEGLADLPEVPISDAVYMA